MMQKETEYTEEQLQSIALRLRDNVFAKIYRYKNTILLCGAAIKNTKSVRFFLNDALVKSFYRYRYDIFYPEDLFDELARGSSSYDLLTVEHLLAESVDVIIVVPESPGSIAELSAFVMNDELRKKIICIQELKYKKKSSFINNGPIRLLKKSHQKVLYVDLERPQEPQRTLSRINSEIKQICKTPSEFKASNIANILHTEKFVLPCIHLMESVSEETLIQIIKYAAVCDEKKAYAATKAALSILSKNRLIEKTPDGFKLTRAGLTNFINLGMVKTSRSYFNNKDMDKLRFDVMNLKYRNKRFK